MWLCVVNSQQGMRQGACMKKPRLNIKQKSSQVAGGGGRGGANGRDLNFSLDATGGARRPPQRCIVVVSSGGDILWPIYFMNINVCVCCAPLISGEPRKGRKQEGGFCLWATSWSFTWQAEVVGRSKMRQRGRERRWPAEEEDVFSRRESSRSLRFVAVGQLGYNCYDDVVMGF